MKIEDHNYYKPLFRLDWKFYIKLIIPLLIGIISWFISDRDTISTTLSICISLFLVIIWFLLELVVRLDKQYTVLKNDTRSLKDSISLDTLNIISRVKRFDEGRIHENQESIIDLLDKLYKEFLVEGRKGRAIHVQAVRYIFISEKIKEFIYQIRHGINEGALTFAGPDSINVTKSLYSLEGLEINAVSYPSFDFWKSREGRAFLERNKESLLSGVSITRYFFVNDTKSTEEIHELCKSLKLHLEYRDKYKLTKYKLYLVKKFRKAEIQAILKSTNDLKFSKIPGTMETQEIPDASLISNNIVSVWNFGKEEGDLDEVRLIFKKQTVQRVIQLFSFFDKNKIDIPSKLTVGEIEKIYSDF